MLDADARARAAAATGWRSSPTTCASGRSCGARSSRSTRSSSSSWTRPGSGCASRSPRSTSSRSSASETLGAAQCLFVDDNELNVEAARELGLTAVQFRSNEQAIPEIRTALASCAASLVLAADAVVDVDLRAPWSRACSSRSCDSQGSTMSSASSSPTPARKASSPRKRAASFSTSRRCSPSPSNDADQELRARHRRADLERGVPGGEHREVLVVEVVDRLRVVLRELVLGDVVDPGLDHGGQQRAPRLPADGLRDHPDRLRRLHEAKRHGAQT